MSEKIWSEGSSSEDDGDGGPNPPLRSTRVGQQQQGRSESSGAPADANAGRSSDDESSSSSEDEQDGGGGQWDASVPADKDTLRILIATDNHLGFMADDPVRGMDSFDAVEEILQKALKCHADMLVFGGDLFHFNKPTRATMHKTMRLFRKYCLGAGHVSMKIHSDQGLNFEGSLFGRANYEDPSLSVQLPVFSIHGNHDDPTRDGTGNSLSALDLLSDCGLINYFGKLNEVENAVVSPILISKGKARLALYGLGWVRDERLSNMFSSNKIKFAQPKGKDSWFNLCMIHQNRQGKGRGPKNCLHESFIPAFMNLVCFGHEHECRINLEESITESYLMTQIGSSVATSLVPGEQEKKHVLLLEVTKQGDMQRFRTKNLELSSVRPFVTDDVVLSRVDELDKEAPANEKSEAVIQYLVSKVNEMIDLAREGRKDNKLPLIRLKVEYTGFTTLNLQRFGARFTDKVANPGEILSFYKKREVTSRKKNKKETDDPIEESAGVDDMESPGDKISTIINDILDHSNKKLAMFEHVGINQALDDFVNKQESSSIREFVQTSVDEMKRTLKRDKTTLDKNEFSEKSFEEKVKQITSEKNKTSSNNPAGDTNKEALSPDQEDVEVAKENIQQKTKSRQKRKAAVKQKPITKKRKTPSPTTLETGSESEYKEDSVEDISEAEEEIKPVRKKMKSKPAPIFQTKTKKTRVQAKRAKKKVITIGSDDDSDNSIEASIVDSNHIRRK